jgi:hypothetical protein
MSIIYVANEQEQLPAASTLIYTCPPNADSAHIIFTKHIIFTNCTNTDTSFRTVTVNIVSSGDAASTSNEYVRAKNISAGDSVSLKITGATLKAGDSVWATASLASTLNLKIDIKEIYT